LARSDFPPGLALLIAAGRLSLDPSTPASPSAASPEDWQASAKAAERHGMSAWLCAALRRWPDTPRTVRDQADATARAQAARALRGVAELSAVVTRLRDAGIEAVALKGPLFSRWVYGDLGSRRFVDLDLLVERKARARASEVLLRAGYTLAGGISNAAAAVIYAGVGAWPLNHAEAFPLDLHWQPQAVRFGSPLSSREVLRDSVISSAGCDLRIPSPTHAATLTLVHAAKHLWASLELVLSIAHLMRRDDIDWLRVRALTGRAATWNGAAASLALAAEIFECDLPGPLRALPRARAVSDLQKAARKFLSMPDVADAPRLAEFRAHRAALDTPRSRIRYAAWRLLAPTPLEWSWCRLPDGLTALYVPVRLLRLSIVGVRDVVWGIRGAFRVR
jgi:hypothetical protein